MVYIEGKNQTRKWTDKKGIERSVTEVVLPDYLGKIVLLDRAERAPGPERDAYEGGADDEPPPADRDLLYAERR